jgi:hypothetical protein
VDEPRIPSYYVASKATPEVIDALRQHPVLCAIIWRAADRDVAAELAPEIIRTYSETDAHFLAAWMPTEVDRPAVVIGGSTLLEAVYANGQRQTLCD